MRLWIARDKQKYPGVTDLCCFTQEPILSKNGFTWIVPDSIDKYFEIDSDLFPEIQFENSPQECEIKLINKNSNEKR